MNKTVLLSICILCFFACRTSKNNLSSEMLISIEKTACYGPCPVYKLSIFSNGLLKLTAEEHLDLKGEYESHISEEDLQAIVAKFVESNFFGFQDAYEGGMTDLPTTYLEFNYDGKSKKIMDYYGAPQRLKDLEVTVSALIKTSDWKNVKSK